MRLSTYIKDRLSMGYYSFTIDEFKAVANKSDTAIKRNLSYLTAKKEIISLRKGFYLIICPCYSGLGCLPMNLYIDYLFAYLKKEYYVGLYTASALHGAGHQRVQRDFVINKPPALLDINNKGSAIVFHSASVWPRKNILKRKCDTGYYNMSSVALTIADLIHYQRKIGGINRILANIEELLEVLKLSDLKDLLEWYPYKSTLQRLGYLIEVIEGETQKSNYLHKYLINKGITPVFLSSYDQEISKTFNKRWQVIITFKLDSDLWFPSYI